MNVFNKLDGPSGNELSKEPTHKEIDNVFKKLDGPPILVRESKEPTQKEIDNVSRKLYSPVPYMKNPESYNSHMRWNWTRQEPPVAPNKGLKDGGHPVGKRIVAPP